MTSLLAGLALLLMLIYDSEVLKKKHLWAFNPIRNCISRRINKRDNGSQRNSRFMNFR